MKIIIALLISLFFTTSLYTQNLEKALEKIREDVAAINQQELYKKSRSPQEIRLDEINVTNYNGAIIELLQLYCDEEKRIRKTIFYLSYPESFGFTINYYDNQGNLIYAINQEFSGLDDAARGVRAFSGGKAVYTDMQIDGEDGNPIGVKEYFGGDVEKFNWNALNITSTSEYENLWDNNNELSSTNKVTFKPFVANGKTIINVRKANLRKAPSSTSAMLQVGGLGTNFAVVELLEQNGDWVKVKTEDGLEVYILAKYVEPIEQAVE